MQCSDVAAKHGGAVFALIPAAGSGSRMGGLTSNTSKVLLDVGGSSILRLTIRSMVASGVCRGIVVLTRGEDLAAAQSLLSEEAQGLECEAAPGGDTRQESVYRGLLLLQGRADYVLIHDGARPFCPPALIADVAREAAATGAAILALPVKPSMKLVSAGVIERSLPRASVYEAQTPQAFRFDLVFAAYQQAAAAGVQATDDAELVERVGERVTVVLGDERNLKITSPQDLELAETLLNKRP